MPSRKPRPSDDELRTLYETRSAQQIADLVGVSKSVVCKWLREADIERRSYSPFSEKRIDCPFSSDRLREMYWHGGMSTREIGEAAAKIIGRDQAVFQKTVQRWMKEAGIDWRTVTEAQIVEARRFPEKHTAEQVVGKGRKSAGSFTPGLSRPVDRKRHQAGVKRAAQLKKQEASQRGGGYIRPCCWPGCSKTTTRRPSEYNAPVWFCGHAHANKYRFASPQTREECLDNARRHIEGY
jgi:transposase